MLRYRGTRIFSTRTSLNGTGSGISTTALIRSITSRVKSARARRINVLADTRALYSISALFACLFEMLKSQGMQMNQAVTLLSDDGDTVRDLQL